LQFAAPAGKTRQDKMSSAVQKTWQRMAPAAQARALALPFGPKEKARVQRALQGAAMPGPSPSTASTTSTTSTS